MPDSDKRQRILKAAEDLIAEVGFQGLSMSLLAQRADVAAGTIYRYFSDKNNLLDEVRLNAMRLVADEVQKGLDNQRDVKTRYHLVWHNIWRLAASNNSFYSIRLQYESLPCTDQYRQRQNELQLFAGINKIFEDGKQQGLLKPLANEILAGLSFEASATISRKAALGLYNLSADDIDAAFEASWDAITLH